MCYALQLKRWWWRWRGMVCVGVVCMGEAVHQALRMLAGSLAAGGGRAACSELEASTLMPTFDAAASASANVSSSTCAVLGSQAASDDKC